ncbi:LysR family transcriptional regulator [Acuticoccus sp. MNP-M23]|uniref:LysR family transcriptional regulator n=1 Tax=Acuticoccus sp. MNP-M23 TaxID=3072793 RepID=UPI00281523C9|nr:LysR family transcriptional regulator [Acuticoccus sp. MNP-M23]WMS44004.1 LysR family transcriptional regulator [Acuticoccus sp. MNP-M23]
MRNLAIYRYVDVTARAGSIRKAAELLSITPSSLNRRIVSLEEELGTPLFERLSRGVRLNTAGEQVVHLFRQHLAEAEGLKTFVADLRGQRRGRVSLVCSQALLPSFLPRQIHDYHAVHPGVRFAVRMADGEAAERALLGYEADLALVFAPLPLNDFQTIATQSQPIHVLMRHDHPLAAEASLRLPACLEYPMALPARPYAVRNLLESAADRIGVRIEATVETESYIFLRNYVAMGETLGFEIKLGLQDIESVGLVSRPLDLGPNGSGLLHVAQLRGRTLPVSSAKFADQITAILSAPAAAV